MVFLLVIAAGARTAEIYLVNSSSSTNLLPVEVSLASLGLQPADYVAEAGGKRFPCEIRGGKLYIAVTVPRFKTLRIELKKAPAQRLSVLKQGESFAVKTERGTVYLSTRGLEGFAVNGERLIVEPRTKGGKLEQAQPGAVSASFVVTGGNGRSLYTVFRSGCVLIEAGGEFRLPASKILNCKRRRFGILTTEPLELSSPHDWAVADYGDKGGIVIAPLGRGSTVAMSKDGVKEFSKQAVLYPVKDVRAGWEVRYGLVPVIVVLRTEGGFKANVPSLKAVGSVQDLDKDGIPDLDSDRWDWDCDANGSVDLIWLCSENPKDRDNEPDYIFLYKGANLEKARLKRGFKAVIGKYSALITAGAGADVVWGRRKEEVVAGPDVRPTLVLEDWDDDGTLLTGSLLEGGHLSSDRLVFKNGLWEVYDLDGDGDGDIFASLDLSGKYGSHFDLRDEFSADYQLSFSLSPPTLSKYNNYYGPQGYASCFCKSFFCGRITQGAMEAFEEHFYYRIRDEDDVDDVFEGDAKFFLKDGGHRLTMGFGKTEAGWMIECNVGYEYKREPVYRVCTFVDKSGHTLKVWSTTLPVTWDGRALQYRWHKKYNAVDILPDCPWDRIASGRYYRSNPSLSMYVVAEGDERYCPEGMYGGGFECSGRREWGAEYSKGIVLYYSPLIGGLHLKNAKSGRQNFPRRLSARWDAISTYYHAEAFKPQKRFVGCNVVGGDKRYMGPLDVRYFDTDSDGYMDTYYYDADNDGVIDKKVYYNHKLGYIEFQQGEWVALWPKKYRFQEVSYRIENYDRIKKLYMRGFREDPIYVRINLSNSGIPIENQPMSTYGEPMRRLIRASSKLVVLAGDWISTAAIDSYHGEGGLYGWSDFSEKGMTRVGEMFNTRGCRLVVLSSPISQQALSRIEVLVVNRLRWVPDEGELLALLAWVRRGGVLLLLYSSEEEGDRVAFNALGSYLGFELAEFISKRSTLVWEALCGRYGVGPLVNITAPGPQNRVEHFEDHTAWSLLEGIDYLSVVGYQLKLGSGMKPLLSVYGKPIMAGRKFGDGFILVSGVNMWSNKYIFHPYFREPTSNAELVQRIVSRLTEMIGRLEILEFSVKGATLKVVIKGKGGTFKFLRSWKGNRVLVNGKEATYKPSGLFGVITLPRGTSEVIIEEVR